MSNCSTGVHFRLPTSDYYHPSMLTSVYLPPLARLVFIYYPFSTTTRLLPVIIINHGHYFSAITAILPFIFTIALDLIKNARTIII